MNTVCFFISCGVFKHVWCVCVVCGVCAVSVCVERRSLNESRLSCVCHRWLLTSSPLLWADRGGPRASERGRGSCRQLPPASLHPALAELLLKPPASHGLLGLRPEAVCPNTSQPVKQHCPPARPRGTFTHTHAGLLLILCVCFMRMRHEMSSNKSGRGSV